MRRALFAGLLVLPTTVSVAGAASISAKKGEIGGPPTIPVGQPDEGTKTSPAIVIGRGRNYDGRVEIVAHGYRDFEPGKHYCVLVEYLPDGIEFGTCASPLQSLQGNGNIQIDAQVQQITPKRQRWTEVGGRVSPDVAAVQVTFRRGGSEKQRHAKAVVAQVAGSLRKKLELPAPFGYYRRRYGGWHRFDPSRHRR